MYAIEQVVESVCDDVSIEDFKLNCNFDEEDDFAEIAIDVEFNEKHEQALLARYICYSLFSQSGVQNLLSSGTNQTNHQLNRERLRNFIESIEVQAVGHPSLDRIYSGKLCVTLSNTLHPSFSIYYRFQLEENNYFWFLSGNYNNAIGGNRFKHRSESWSQTEMWNVWVNSLGENTTTALRQWLTNETDEKPHIDFDFTSIIPQVDNHTLVSLGGMSNHMGSDPEISSYIFLRRALGNISDSTNPIQSKNVFQHLLRDTVIKTANIHVEPRRKFDYAEWDEPSSSLLDGSGLALYLFRLKNGSKPEREEFARICVNFSKLTNGRKLDVQLKTVLEYTDSLNTFRYHPIQRRIKPRRKPVSIRESKGMLDLEITTTNQDGREFSISRSGAGMFELALLCTVLNVSKSHVVLLDEPGIHVHASIQRHVEQLLQQIDAQIFVVTHSPYLLSSKSLKNCRRIHLENGISRISSPFRPSDNQNYRLRSEQAFERDLNRANALFSDLVLLADGESEYHSLPIWFEKYCEVRNAIGLDHVISGLSFEQLNVHLIYVGGKRNYPSYLRFIHSFDVKWMILCDGDSLGPNDNICNQLKEFDIKTPENIPFSETKALLCVHNVFVLGGEESDNFETIPEVRPLLKLAENEVGKSKARQAQWIAEQTKCPEILVDLFARIIDLTSTTDISSHN